EPGHGATFRIYLPLASDETPTAAPPARAPGRDPSEGQQTVLLVEDDDGVRRFATELLTGGGYRVLAADDGPAALQLAADHDGAIDLLLTDVVMPRMTGRQVADSLRERHEI